MLYPYHGKDQKVRPYIGTERQKPGIHPSQLCLNLVISEIQPVLSFAEARAESSCFTMACTVKNNVQRSTFPQHVPVIFGDHEWILFLRLTARTVKVEASHKKKVEVLCNGPACIESWSCSHHDAPGM